MTLIVSAVTKEIAAVASDGLEFRHTQDGSKYVETVDRQKIFPIPERSALLAVHGQNRLTTPGQGLDSQRLVGEVFNDLYSELVSIPTIEGIANRLLDVLTPDVDHTLSLLKSEWNHHSPLGIVVIGFDVAGGRTRGFEAYWPSLNDKNNRKGVIKHVLDKDEVRVLFSGTGDKYARSVIDQLKFKYDQNKLKRASEQKVQTYVCGVFQDAFKRQKHTDLEFGGQCQVVTVVQTGFKSRVFALGNDVNHSLKRS